MKRNLHFFWPRAERGIYAEMKRLAALGVASTTRETTGRRARTVYKITSGGQKALKGWLGSPPTAASLEFETLLRVLLAPITSDQQLLLALDKAIADANALLVLGETIGQEYLAGRAPFQRHVATRAFVFDFFTDFASAISKWAERTAAEVHARQALTEEEKRRRGLNLIERRMRSLAESPQRAKLKRKGRIVRDGVFT
jgi:DNA-binding PadR family transcriptional regulator